MLNLEIHPQTPQTRHLKTISDSLNRDLLLLYPTDSGYAVCCSAESSKAINKLYALKKPMKKAFMSLMLPDISQATEYARISNFAFSILKNHTPGPYTFILPADPQIARKLDVTRHEIGIRISPHIFIRSLFDFFDKPLISTAAKLEDSQAFTTPEELLPIFQHKVDVFANMGEVPLNPTNIVSLIGDEVKVIRGEF